MKRAVLMSIRPRWCNLIANGDKTIEIRKTRPKMKTPFKCYIYCTKAEERLLEIIKDGDENYGEIYHGKPVFIKTSVDSVCDMYGKRQKVIGEFVCDRIDRLAHIGYTGDPERPKYRIVDDWQKAHDISRLLEAACLTEEELETYLKGETGFGWHISDLKIYSRPVDITNFHNCLGCEYVGDCDTYCWDPVQIPPQSWRYVQENEGVAN